MSDEGLKVVEDSIDTTKALTRKSKRDLLNKIKRKRVIHVIDPSTEDYEGVDVEVELREPTHAERQELIRELTNRSESKKGRRALKQWGITAADYQNLGLIVGVTFDTDTDEPMWKRSDIPDLLEMGPTALAPLQRAVFEILGMVVGADVEEEDEGDGLGLTDEEKKR